jgi:copper chaperone CopZ
LNHARSSAGSPDIACDHCTVSIEKVVTKQAGVRFISGDPQKKAVKIEYDPSQATTEEIGAMMEEEGYPLKA